MIIHPKEFKSEYSDEVIKNITLSMEDLPRNLALEIQYLRSELKDWRAGANAEAMAGDEARAEVKRLKEGNFTATEFQNLCHNKEKSVTPEEFCAGCEEYQKKLFGESEITKLKERIKFLESCVSEEKLLDNLFDEKRTWRGHRLDWCDLCDVASIKLECCGNGSCSGGGCDKCCGPTEGFDSTDFCRLTKPHIRSYLNDKEERVYEKILFIKKYILESLGAGFNEINWQYLHENGKLCDLAYDLFDNELKDSKNWKKYAA